MAVLLNLITVIKGIISLNTLLSFLINFNITMHVCTIRLIGLKLEEH